MKGIKLSHFKSIFQMETSWTPPPTGTFPITLKAKDTQRYMDVALKIYPAGAKGRDLPEPKLKEKVLSIYHPNLLTPLDHFEVYEDDKEDAKGQKLFDVVSAEFIGAGNLVQYKPESLPVSEKKRILLGIIDGLEAIHAKGVAHGNLSPHNILIQDLGYPHVRLTDFGLSKNQSFENPNVNFPKGSVKYMAPELLAPRFIEKGNSQLAADFWSLGIIIFELFSGQYPFGDLEAAQNTDWVTRISLMEIPPFPSSVPHPFRLLGEKCLSRAPGDRPKNIKAVRDLLATKPPKATPPPPKPRPSKPAPEKPKTPLFQRFKKPKPIPVVCKHCGTANKPFQALCHNCDAPLGGPESLKYFKDPSAVGFWALTFFTILLLPVFFFYLGLYEACDFPQQPCDLQSKIEEAVEDIKNNQHPPDSYLIFIPFFGPLVLFFVGGGLFEVFYLWWLWRTSSNLSALGSRDRRFAPLYLFIIFLMTALILLGGGKDAILIVIGLLVLSSILSLYTLQEIWKGSDATFLIPGTGWKRGKGSFLIFSRWAMSFLFPFIVFLPVLPSFQKTIHQSWFIFWIGMIILYWAMTIIAVSRINFRQRMKYLALAKLGSAASPAR